MQNQSVVLYIFLYCTLPYLCLELCGRRDTDCEHDSVLQELTLASEKLPPVSG